MKSVSQIRLFNKSLRKLAVAGAILMSTSAGVFAQTMSEPATHQVTRAEVRHELEELEAAGYNPSQGDDVSYPADLQAAAKAGTLKPNDDTAQNPSYALAAGGVISTADDLAIWMRALAGGKLFHVEYQRQWLDSLEPQDPSKPLGQTASC